jgi:hypothetical protein
MTKAITGFSAVGVGFGPVATRTARTAGEHSDQMAVQCEQTAARLGDCGEAAGRT